MKTNGTAKKQSQLNITKYVQSRNLSELKRRMNSNHITCHRTNHFQKQCTEPMLKRWSVIYLLSIFLNYSHPIKQSRMHFFFSKQSRPKTLVFRKQKPIFQQVLILTHIGSKVPTKERTLITHIKQVSEEHEAKSRAIQ